MTTTSLLQDLGYVSINPQVFSESESIPVKIINSYHASLANFNYNGQLIIIIDGYSQKLYLLNSKFSDPYLLNIYPVSTSKFGFGFEEGSMKTPTGVFSIKDKIGASSPLGSIFVAKKDTGLIAEIITADEDFDVDYVLSRVLTLDGKEPNNSNSFERYIYIHGTSEEGLIGTPASHGCVRMLNDDVISLFNQVSAGTLVVILE